MEEVRVITESEWKILQQLWANEPMTITRLTKAFEQDTGWTKHTIISFLNRMEEKDLVFYREDGRARQYYTLIDRDVALTQEAELFLQKTASVGALDSVRAVMQAAGLSEKEREDLKKWMDGFL